VDQGGTGTDFTGVNKILGDNTTDAEIVDDESSL
jgi:hypothetical protein